MLGDHRFDEYGLGGKNLHIFNFHLIGGGMIFLWDFDLIFFLRYIGCILCFPIAVALDWSQVSEEVRKVKL